MQTSALRFRINLIGAVAIAAHLAMALLSYVQAPALWQSHPAAPRAVEFFNELAGRYPLIALYRYFDDNAQVLISYCAPLAVVTAAALMLLQILHRSRGASDASVVNLLLRWAMAFAAVQFFAFPVFTQDFWLSMAWGRLLAAGLNPYHHLFTPESLAGLPLDHFPMVMSYGPVWALLSGAVMLVSGSSVLVAAILFKAILLATWYWSLTLVERLTQSRPVTDRCLAMVCFGWMPLGVLQTMSEGHNDIFMVWLTLLWLSLLLRGRWQAPVALVASALSKYVTGPLILVDAIAALRVQRLPWRALAMRYVVPGVFGAGVFALFYRSAEFFDGTRTISEWRFLQPRDALTAIEELFDISLYPVALAITASFAVLVAYNLVALYKDPVSDKVIKAALAVMAGISFAFIAHLWPWYLVWTMALAALLPGWWLSRFVIGVSIVAPFALSFWWIDAFENSREWAAVGMYLIAILWIVATRIPAMARAPERSADTAVDPLATGDA